MTTAERVTALTDKFRLGYGPVYAELALAIGEAGRVLEVGVGNGGSLIMWQELFPRGLVAGVDISGDAVWPPGTVRIVADQASDAMAAAARDASPDGYDLIVDDASHNGPLSAATFRLLWPLVRPGRWYALEDWAVGVMTDEELAGYKVTRDQVGGDSMAQLAYSFLGLVGGEAQEIRYRYSLALVQRVQRARP